MYVALLKEPTIKEIKCHADTNKENLWEYIKHNQIAQITDISTANTLLLEIPKSLRCFTVMYAYIILAHQV